MKGGNNSVSVGVTSILTVFVVLCLTVFAVLALVSVNSERGISEKAAMSVTDYYNADLKAVEFYDNLKSYWDENGVDLNFAAEAENLGGTAEETFDGATVRFYAEIDEKRTLETTIEATLMEFKITGWNVTSEITEINNEVVFWDGNLPLWN